MYPGLPNDLHNPITCTVGKAGDWACLEGKYAHSRSSRGGMHQREQRWPGRWRVWSREQSPPLESFFFEVQARHTHSHGRALTGMSTRSVCVCLSVCCPGGARGPPFFSLFFLSCKFTSFPLCPCGLGDPRPWWHTAPVWPPSAHHHGLC